MFFERLSDALYFDSTVPFVHRETLLEKLGFFFFCLFLLGFFPVNFVIIFGERLSIGNLIFILSHLLNKVHVIYAVTRHNFLVSCSSDHEGKQLLYLAAFKNYPVSVMLSEFVCLLFNVFWVLP